MSEQEKHELGKLLTSKYEPDINLAGALISNQPDRDALVKELITPIFGEDSQDVLESKWTFGLTERKLERYLTAIYSDSRLKKQRDIVLYASMEGAETLDEVIKESTKLFEQKAGEWNVEVKPTEEGIRTAIWKDGYHRDDMFVTYYNQDHIQPDRIKNDLIDDLDFWKKNFK